MSSTLLPIVTLPLGLVGLIVPGYLVATALRMPAAWAAALPLSSLFICLAITLLQVLGISLGFAAVGALLATVAAAACAAGRSQPPRDRELANVPLSGPHSAILDRIPSLAMIGFVAATVAVFALRVTLYPLSGFDTLWRWEYLTRLMLEHRSLAFYPPRSAADYEVYFYPEGIPPLVSGVYWWLYAAAGRPLPTLTAVAVVGQLASIGGLVHLAATRLWGAAAGWPAVAILFATPLFVSAVAIGQETGFTALSIAGQLAAAVAARQQGSARLALAAGLFAAVGASAREYGLALVAVGGLVLMEERRGWRLLPAYLLVAIACAAPWYLRTWALTGNPVFSNPTPLGLPSNPVHEGILGEYRAVLGLSHLPGAGWMALGTLLLVCAGPLLVAALVAVAAIGRRMPAIIAGVLLVVLLWAWSVGFTAGGLGYSVRVLSPAWVMLAIAAAAVIPRGLAVARKGTIFAAIGTVAGAAWAGFSLAHNASHPLGIHRLPRAALAMRSDPIDTYAGYQALARALDRSRVVSCRVVIDDAYFAAILHRCGSRFRPLLVWSPALVDLFDERSRVAEARRRLADLDAPLVCINNGLNWRYVQRGPFFREDAPTWKTAFQLDGATIRSMPTVKPLALLPE